MLQKTIISRTNLCCSLTLEKNVSNIPHATLATPHT